MHYPPETGSIMLIVRLMALYQQSTKKEEFLEQLQSFQSLIVNREQKIYHKMLGENFEQQMEQLYLAFCNAFTGEEFSIVCISLQSALNREYIFCFPVQNTGCFQDIDGHSGN